MKAILTYHSIDPTGSPISVDEETFRRHVRWLASGAVRVTTIDELLTIPESESAVAITFDDAFSNFRTLAAPLLLDHGLPVTLFVVSDQVGQTNAWCGVPDRRVPTLPLLDWDALGNLADAGVLLGAHGRTHRDLTTLSGADLQSDVVDCIEHLVSRTGRTPTAFAYPFGSFDDATAAIVASVFSYACTTELRLVESSDLPHMLPRLDMYYFQRHGRLEAYGSARFRRYLWLRAQARRVGQHLASVGEA